MEDLQSSTIPGAFINNNDLTERPVKFVSFFCKLWMMFTASKLLIYGGLGMYAVGFRILWFVLSYGAGCKE